MGYKRQNRVCNEVCNGFVGQIVMGLGFELFQTGQKNYR